MPTTVRRGAITLATLLIAVSAHAADHVVRPVRIDDPPRIDGRLDEPLWLSIEPVTGFSQYDPDNGAPPSEPTEVRICYDRRALYLGIRAHDSEPDKLIARHFERDSTLVNDDTVSVALDTLDDNRSAVLFLTNLRGMQVDMQITEDGHSNLSWDAIWHTRGQRDEHGYTIEIAIPFFSLRFKPAEEIEMGIYLDRAIRRRNEIDTWPPMSRDYDVQNVSQYARLVGLTGIERTVNLEVMPYAIAGYSETPADDDSELDAGLDLKWGPATNQTVDLTINPDFAQVESDDLRVNLTRFSLFYPEKRDFFLERADVFKFGIPQTAEVFFSRRIGLAHGQEVPILGGVRGHGLLGRTNLGIMTIETDDEGDRDSESFSVARFKHNVLGRSYVGGIVTSRRGIDQEDDVTMGGDFMLLFGRNLRVQGLAARSDRPGPDSNNWMASVSLSQYTDLYDWMIRYDDIGADFAPGIGYIQRPDQRTVGSNVHYKPRPDWPGIRQLTLGMLYWRIENHDGVLETRRARPGLVVELDSDDAVMFLYEDMYDRVPVSFPIAPDVVVAAGEYDNRQGRLYFYSNPGRAVTVNASAEHGSFYDGDLSSAGLDLGYKPLPRLHVGLAHSYDGVELPDGDFDSNISRLSVSYFLSSSLAARIAAQYSSLVEDLVINFRVRWNYAPGSEAWLVYDEGRRYGTDQPSLRDRALILKIVHNFRF